MNTIYAPAFAAFGGSAFGAISTIVTGWVTRRRRLRERTDLIWDELQRDLTPEEWGRISLTIGMTPDQVNGASIHDIKAR